MESEIGITGFNPGLIEGTSQEFPPHLPIPSKWFKSNQVTFRRGRVREEIPKKQIAVLQTNRSFPVSNIVSIKGFLGGSPSDYYLIFSQGTLWRMDAAFNVGVVPFMGITRVAGAARNAFTELSGYGASVGGSDLFQVRVKTSSPAATYEWAVNGGAFGGANLWSASQLITDGLRSVTFPGFFADNLLVGQRWDISFVNFVDSGVGGLTRACIRHGSGIYFPSTDGIAKYTGAFWYIIDDGYLGTASFPQFLENLYEHLMVFGLNLAAPSRLLWSTLNDFTTYIPSITNEADLYDIEQVPIYVANGFFNPGTDMKKLRNQCIEYLQYKIVTTDYVGFPFIMQTRGFCDNVGSYFKNGVASYENKHYFWSENNCWRFDGVSLTPIGDAAKEQFYSEVTQTNAGLLTQYYAEVDVFNQEINFHFCNASLANFDVNSRRPNRKATYNLKDGSWYFTDSNYEVTCPADTTLKAVYIRSVKSGGLWTSTMYTDWIDGIDSTGIKIAQSPFYLESRDFTIPERYMQLKAWDLQTEIEGLLVDANFTQGTGINVFISTRQYASDPVTWEYIGQYTKTEPSRITSFPRINGRIFRLALGATPSPLAATNSRTQDLVKVDLTDYLGLTLVGVGPKFMEVKSEV